MKRYGNSGFTLVEFVVAVVFIGVVLGPFLLFAARIHDLNSAIGMQARREARQSLADQALARGIDPSVAPGLMPAKNAAIPPILPPAIEQLSSLATPGMPRIVALRAAADPSSAPRALGAGYQIGAGITLGGRSTPVAPLAPIVMPAPVITPTDGSIIAISSLAVTQDGHPYTAQIQATSSSGANVVLSFNQPIGLSRGMGFVERAVTAVDLANRVNGSAWAEYAGSNGDRPVALSDGRTRWFVTRPDGRLQIYEPSIFVSFGYQIGLSAPVLEAGGVEYSNGAVVSFDYDGFSQVQRGAASPKIGFPASVRKAFGDGWPAQSIGFQWTFNDVAGSFSGDLAAFFQPDRLPVWDDVVGIKAVPVVPAGVAADSAEWTFRRIKTALGVPVLESADDGSGFYPAGQLQFTAPRAADGTRVGRLSFDNGANISTGPTIPVTVIP